MQMPIATQTNMLARHPGQGKFFDTFCLAIILLLVGACTLIRALLAVICMQNPAG